MKRQHVAFEPPPPAPVRVFKSPELLKQIANKQAGITDRTEAYNQRRANALRRGLEQRDAYNRAMHHRNVVLPAHRRAQKEAVQFLKQKGIAAKWITHRRRKRETAAYLKEVGTQAKMHARHIPTKKSSKAIYNDMKHK